MNPSTALIGRPSRRLARLLTAGLLGLAPAVSGALLSPASAARLPDLKMGGVSTTTRTIVQGEQVTVRDTTRNAGRAKAGRSKTRFYLSVDRDYDATDRVLGTRRVGALRPGTTDRGRKSLVVPSSTPARDWYVVACADAARKVKESRERNNCRASADPFEVVEPEPDLTFPLDPDPLSVDSALQTARAVSQTINPHENSTITATAADGTTYTLRIPANALLGGEQITMTPVASVPGLPLSGGLVAGVQIEPHGLMLQRPAELTIDSPDAGPLAQQTAFLFREGGADFHLYPMAPPQAGDDADIVRMNLTHFSTPGLGSGTDADRGNVDAHPPAHPQAQLEAEISEFLRQQRENQGGEGGNPDPGSLQPVVDVMNTFYDDVIRKQLQAAETNDDLAAEAISAGLGWSRQLQLLGDNANPRHAEIMERVERILRNVKDSAWADCQDHDLTSVSKLFGVARQAALFGYAWSQEAQEKAFGCVRFEVRLDSLITSAGSFSGTLQSGEHDARWHTAGSATVEFLGPDPTGPLSFTEFSYFGSQTIHDSDPDCTNTTVGTTTTPGRMRAGATPMAAINVREGVPFPKPPVFAHVMVPGATKPTETYQLSSCNGAVETWDDSRWASAFDSRQWTFQPSEQLADLIGTKTWTESVSDENSTDTERTTIEVWHRPQV